MESEKNKNNFTILKYKLVLRWHWGLLGIGHRVKKQLHDIRPRRRSQTASSLEHCYNIWHWHTDFVELETQFHVPIPDNLFISVTYICFCTVPDTNHEMIIVIVMHPFLQCKIIYQTCSRQFKQIRFLPSWLKSAKREIHSESFRQQHHSPCSRTTRNLPSADQGCHLPATVVKCVTVIFALRTITIIITVLINNNCTD